MKLSHGNTNGFRNMGYTGSIKKLNDNEDTKLFVQDRRLIV